MIDYTGNPFYLDEEGINWVENTYRSMSVEERLGQLFCPIVFSKDEKELRELVETKHPGGVLYREGPGEELYDAQKLLQEYSRIPLLTASNLEYGGTGSADEGTYYGRQMLVAATGNSERAYQLGYVSCMEGSMVGVNWSFAPVSDLDLNFRNPITNVRTFGSNKDTVLEMCRQYIRGAKEAGVATAIKHYPGDGVDERDQHLVTSVNSLSKEEWDATYGKIYKALIDEGTLSVMGGHIALPAYEEYYDGKEEKKVLPATLSKNLLQHLLREQLGFNGVITTDATPMTGFCAAMERKTAVPLAIENGCDVFLFNRNMDEDWEFMREGYRNGILSEERLEEAVKRILTMKAAMGLHRKKEKGTLLLPKEELQKLNQSKFDSWARECAEEGVTLVKDTVKLLPLSPQKHKRVLLEIMGEFESNERVIKHIISYMEKEGFEVTLYQKEGFEVMMDSVSDFKARYDLIFYVGNIETVSNKTTARLNWHTMFGLGNNMPWMANEMPCVFLSLGNPYHLFDAPMIHTYINGYCNSDYVIEAALDKMLGKGKFKGISPVDAFCGRKELAY